jgi:hypothetical protein
MAQVVRDGHHAISRVSIWAQWLGVAVGVLISPVFALFWGLVPRLAAHSPVMAAPKIAPGHVPGDPALPRRGS